MKRLIKKANNLTKEQEKFIQECEESRKFDDKQMKRIRYGFENGLTMDQVKLYADPKFEWNQMYQIKKGFENGLTMEQVKLYADPKFEWNQMEEMRKGFENGLTMDQVKFYADPKFNDFQMWQIREGFEQGLTMEQVKLYADPKFNYSQMEAIREGFKNGLTMEQVKVYADPKFDWFQMLQIRKGFENGLTMEEIKSKYKLASRKNKLNRIANNNIPNIFEFGLTKKEVLDDFADNVIDFYTIEEIKEFFEEYPTIKDQINLINDTITVCINESYFDLWDKYYNCNPKLINEYCEKYNVDIKEVTKQILNNISIDEFLGVAVKARIDFYNRNFEKYMK